MEGDKGLLASDYAQIKTTESNVEMATKAVVPLRSTGNHQANEAAGVNLKERIVEPRIFFFAYVF